MARKKKNTKIKLDVYEDNEHITEQDFNDITKKAMVQYFINNNFKRQVASLNDGLKPVERRILYSMYRSGLSPSKTTVKSAKVIGDIAANFHPHGDSSLYDSVVGLSQEWLTPYPYIFQQGNFGDQYKLTEGAAAMRYTETKLTQFAWDAFFKDFNINYIFTDLTYDDKNLEPEYLPSRYPIMLIQGTFGIASGMKAGVPSYNLKEVLEATIKLITNPDEKIILYPDSPTGCDIIMTKELRDIALTGQGSFDHQATYEIDEDSHSIIFRTIPYQVKGSNIVDRIMDMDEKGIIQGLVEAAGYADLSPYEPGYFGILVRFKKEIDLHEMAKLLLQRTDLRKDQHVYFIAINDLKIEEYNVRTYLLEWIEFRREYKTIAHTHEIISNQSRIHELETILYIFTGKNGERSLNIIRKAENENEIIKFLQDEFDVTSIQARSISNTRLSEFSKEGIEKKKQELKNLQKRNKELEKIIRNPSLIDLTIIEELEEGIKKYGRPRRSKLIKLDSQKTEPVTEHLVAITKNGFVRKFNGFPESTGNINDGDKLIRIVKAKSDMSLWLFDHQGDMYKYPIKDIPTTDLNDYGHNLSKELGITGDIVSAIIHVDVDKEVLDNEDTRVDILILTKNGTIKKTPKVDFTSSRRKLVAATLEKGDEVVDVIETLTDKTSEGSQFEIIVYTEKGFGVRYSPDEVRVTGRSSKGVIGIDHMDDGDSAKGCVLIVPARNTNVICLTEKGHVKQFKLDTFRAMNRTAKPLRLTSLGSGDLLHSLIDVPVANKGELITMTKTEKLKFPVTDIDVMTRLAKGKKLVPVRRGDYIISAYLN